MGGDEINLISLKGNKKFQIMDGQKHLMENIIKMFLKKSKKYPIPLSLIKIMVLSNQLYGSHHQWEHQKLYKLAKKNI